MDPVASTGQAPPSYSHPYGYSARGVIPSAREQPRGEGRDKEVVRVLVSAENEVLRAGLASIIELHPGFSVDGSGLRNSALVDDVQTGRHDILLAECHEGGGLRFLLEARRDGALPAIPVVALLTDDVPDVLVLGNLIRQGVDGIVSANDKGAQLSGALLAVRLGHRWLSPTLGGRLLEHLVEIGPARTCSTSGSGPTGMSSREWSILVLVAEGLTVAQIAKRVHRSESAVKYHLSNLGSRYQANNRAHLVYLAVQAGELQIS